MTQEIIERQDPYTEAYKRGLFESAFDLVNQRLGFQRVPTGKKDEAGNEIFDMVETGTGQLFPPTRQVAGLTPMQQQARMLTQENLGGFMPYIQGGLGGLQRGQALLEQAAQLAGETRETPFQYGEAGATAIQGGMDAFRPGTLDDPSSGISAFFNPFEDEVVGQVQRDFDRARREQDAISAATAIDKGAFGGSRAEIARQQAIEGLNRQELDALSRLRTAGYSEALSAAQQAQEAQQRRALTGGAYLGNIGQALGTVGQRDVQILGDVARGIGTIGQQEAALGPIAAREARSDVSALNQLGGQEQLVEQNVLDAMRLTNIDRQEFPSDQYAYLQDILSGVPARASRATYTSNPTQSAAAQAISTGIAGLGALSAGVA
tara:strand:- start:378 stop:1511 length:1134 start_codon:yes stop_codon:yes gene_type:complete